MNEELNQFNGGGMPQTEFQLPQDDRPPIWAALISFVLSLVNLLMCCCCTYVTVPVSITLGILTLVKKWRGKGLAIAGIVISAVTLIFMILSNVMFREESEDLTKVYMNPGKYMSEYQETHEVPEEFQKYYDSKYDAVWVAMGTKDFNEFYDIFITQVIPIMFPNAVPSGYGSSESSNSSKPSEDSNSKSSRPSNYGEDPITI